ncbi:MAG TPA: ATP-dependent sacrificial sulfur transferase LarE [Methanoregulaceae archaeon]|nr:ATP-dependent sacrificial sulfur transferase LarE [Methanoregulaceae archaeon]
MHDRTTTPESSDHTESKLLALQREIERIGPLLVSYSGGVDSALLAVVAHEVLGERMACAFLDSPVIPRAAVAEAREIAREFGLPLMVISHDPLEIPAFVANPSDRCYHCKKALAPFLKREAAGRGFPTIVDGANCSDLGEHRPGLIASAEEDIIHPFVTVGITKPEIRAIARSLSLSFAEKPSAACLSSRFPYGDPITPTLLAMVEEAEEALRRTGFGQGRVRAHGRLARIEVPLSDLDRALRQAPDLVAALKAAGFAYVTLDLEGYRSGAMDEVLGVRPK